MEGRGRVIRFPHEDPEIFGPYLSLAYNSQEIKKYAWRISSEKVPTDRDAFHEWYDPWVTRLAHVFVLANMLLDTDTMHAVYSQIKELGWKYFSFD